MLGFEKNEEFMQCSWNYMNDSLRTNVFVRYDPETIACACVYLSAKKLKIPMLKEPPWYSLFGAKEDDLLEICYSILRLYNRPKANADKLERIVVELQTKYQEERARQRKLAGLLNSANNTPAQNSLSPSTPAVKKPIPEVSPRSKETRRSDTPSPHKHKSKSSKKHRQSSTSLSRSRSRSRDRGRKKLKSRNGSISPPHSPDYKRSHKSREKRYRSRSRSRDRRDRSRSRSYDRYKYHEKSKKHKYRDDASRKRKEIRR
ncbi:Hypothetical predicted protein [Cloeon dipterum]|nr:Hypothetical predicted protein [Cloeon dipterum]